MKSADIMKAACAQCRCEAEFTIFRGEIRVHACRDHLKGIMAEYDGYQTVVGVEEASELPEGTSFVRDFTHIYDEGHWFNQELGALFLRLLNEERSGSWVSNGIVYGGPEEKAAMMTMVLASLSSMIGKTMATFLTNPGVTLDHPDLMAMVNRLLTGHTENARDEAVAWSALLERNVTGGTVQ